jgi:hypothetical protein
MPHPRKLFVPMMALVAAGFATGIVLAAPAPSLPAATDASLIEESFVPVAGVGETMIIVVGGDFPSLAEAQAAAEAAQETFGHLQGFYVDEAANYEVVGVYEQTSANQRVVPCAVWQRETKMECPPGLSEVRAFQPVKLRHVSRVNARSFLSGKDEASCGSPGNRPCARTRLGQLLTADLALKPDRFLLLNAYRTKRGAAEGVEFSRMAAENVSVLRVRKTGGGYVGLGQEAHPNGSGPLDRPLPDAAKYQE